MFCILVRFNFKEYRLDIEWDIFEYFWKLLY